MARKNKKKRKYPLNIYSVEYEYMVRDKIFVKAESENHARQIAQDNAAEFLECIDAEKVDPNNVSKGESILNEDGTFE